MAGTELGREYTAEYDTVTVLEISLWCLRELRDQLA